MNAFKRTRGIRISGRLTKEEKQALAAQGKESNEISSSQMGYNELVDVAFQVNKKRTALKFYF